MRRGKWSSSFPGDDFVGGLDDQLGFFCREFAEVLIDERGGFFEDAEGADELGRHGVFADGKVNQRARGLSAVVTVGGNFHLAHAVGLGAGFAGVDSLDGVSSPSSLAGFLGRAYMWTLLSVCGQTRTLERHKGCGTPSLASSWLREIEPRVARGGEIHGEAALGGEGLGEGQLVAGGACGGGGVVAVGVKGKWAVWAL